MIDISTFITFSNGYIKDADDDEAYDDFRGYIPFHYSPIHLHLLGSELQRLRADFQTYETFSLTKKVKTFYSNITCACYLRFGRITFGKLDLP